MQPKLLQNSQSYYILLYVTVNSPYTLKGRTHIGVQIGIVFIIFVLLLLFSWDNSNFWKEMIWIFLYIRFKTTKNYKESSRWELKIID